MKPVEPLQTVELFQPLSRELIKLLRSLQPGDWQRPTACGDWTVQDVTAHLLGGSLGRLNTHPTQNTVSPPPALAFDELLALIDRGNAEWVQAARRISPPLLIEFLAICEPQVYQRFRALDPYAPAGITVAWVSDDLPPNWLDIAREYTERWLHQQHIRMALARPLLGGRSWLHPALDAFLRGLPRTFRGLEAAPTSAISIQIRGPAGGDWSLLREDGQWSLYEGSHPLPACRLSIPADLAWRLFTKGIRPQDARPQVTIEGDPILGERVLQLVAIMA